MIWSLVCYFLFGFLLSWLNGAVYVGLTSSIFFLIAAFSLLRIDRLPSSHVAIKTATLIAVAVLLFWCSGFLFANITVTYDTACPTPSSNCAGLVQKRVSYWAPTDRMLIDGFNKFINAGYVPRITTLLPGSIPPFSFFFLGPLEMKNELGVAKKRFEGDGYAAHVTRGDTLYFLHADENVSPFRFYIHDTSFPKSGESLFDYYFSQFYEPAVALSFLLMIGELVLFFFRYAVKFIYRMGYPANGR